MASLRSTLSIKNNGRRAWAFVVPGVRGSVKCDKVKCIAYYKWKQTDIGSKWIYFTRHLKLLAGVNEVRPEISSLWRLMRSPSLITTSSYQQLTSGDNLDSKLATKQLLAFPRDRKFDRMIIISFGGYITPWKSMRRTHLPRQLRLESEMDTSTTTYAIKSI